MELYNPRIHAWDEHFLWNGPLVVGSTAIGRATLYLLNMNEDERVQMRTELQTRGEL